MPSIDSQIFIIYGYMYIYMKDHWMTPENLFRALSDTTRLRTLLLLATEGELCVCELTHALEQSQPKISRHLAMLRDLGIVKTRRQGQWVLYSLHPELPDWAGRIVQTTAETLADALVAEDRDRLHAMCDRPLAGCSA